MSKIKQPNESLSALLTTFMNFYKVGSPSIYFPDQLHLVRGQKVAGACWRLKMCVSNI